MNKYNVRINFNGDEFHTVVSAKTRSEAISKGRKEFRASSCGHKKIDSINAVQVICG